MVQGYYTLQEAAQFLHISVDELKQMSQKGKVRSFQDRGTLRFRIQDIQELGRQRGEASDPGLILGDASLPSPSKAKPKTTPSSAAKSTPPGAKSGSPSSTRRAQQPAKSSPKQTVPEVFDFAVDNDSPNIGADVLGAPKSRGEGSKSGRKPTTPRTPPSAGSDSDVRLVADGSDVTFSFAGEDRASDSDVKLPSDAARPRSGPGSSGSKKSSQVALGSGVQAPRSGLSPKPGSPRPGSGPQPVDSGVRLVPLDDDSDVKILGASDEVSLGDVPVGALADSNVRLERAALPPADSGEGGMVVTEEVNLDEELRKHEERGKKQPGKVKPRSDRIPPASPFELSESEMKMPSELMDEAEPRTPKRQVADTSDSSDFELAIPKPEDDSSDFDLQASSPVTDDSELALSDDSSAEEQVLQDELSTELGPTSGISLSNPVDGGISLEDHQTEEEIDFDLSLKVEDTPRSLRSRPADESSNDFELKIADTPKPGKYRPGPDSGSDFEINAPGSSDEHPAARDSDDIDLSLEVGASGEMAAQAGDSDSEFELTLDDSGNLAALEGDSETPQVKAKGAGSDEQDIFESDFEVPALDSDSGNVAAADQESSDFDLALDDSELAVEEESGSQVVALDEEDSAALAEGDSDAVAVDDVAVEEEGEFGELDADVQVEADEDADVAVATKTVLKPKLVQAAPWGVMPVIFMLPCVIIMFLVGILAFELVQTTTGVRPPGPLTVAIADLLNEKISAKK